MKLQRDLIWILEDDLDSAEILRKHISDEADDFEIFTSLKGLRERLDDKKCEMPLMLIADLTVDDGNFVDDFLEVEEAKGFLRFPFMVISSTKEDDVLRRCFDKGACDYITKPFVKEEVKVKIERIIRNVEQKREDGIQGGCISSEDVVLLRGPKINFSVYQRKFVDIFLKAKENRVSKQRFVDEIWDGAVVQLKSMEVHLCYIRKKIAPYGLHIQYLGHEKWRLISIREDYPYDPNR